MSEEIAASKMLDFQLFRVKVRPSPQRDLFVGQQGPRDLLLEVVQSTPEASLRRGMTWHIGNVQQVREDGLYFRVGRTTRQTLEVFEDGLFADETFETAPYTHALLDLRLEVLALARKARLSPSVPGIARQLARLLNDCPATLRCDASFEIDELTDPEDFISHLRTAQAIYKFTVWFTRPNPWDVNQDFVAPAQRLVAATKSEVGKTELKGKALEAVALEDISRSAAATGDDAAAWLKPARSRRRAKKRLRGNPVVFAHEQLDNETAIQGLLSRLREIYHRIRGSGAQA